MLATRAHKNHSLVHAAEVDPRRYQTDRQPNRPEADLHLSWCHRGWAISDLTNQALNVHKTDLPHAEHQITQWWCGRKKAPAYLLLA